MSGHEEIIINHPTFGPRKQSRLDLMGIRFANDAEGGEGGAGSGAGEYKAPETQADLDRIISERLGRERDKFKDYDAFKTKAQQFDELQRKPAGQTQSDGTNDATTTRLNELATSLDTVQKTSEETSLKLLRAEVALDKSISKEDLVLLTGTTREDLETQADRINKIASASKAGSGRVPGQGGRDSTATSGGSVSAGRDLFENRKK